MYAQKLAESQIKSVIHSMQIIPWNTSYITAHVKSIHNFTVSKTICSIRLECTHMYVHAWNTPLSPYTL